MQGRTGGFHGLESGRPSGRIYIHLVYDSHSELPPCVSKPEKRKGDVIDKIPETLPRPSYLPLIRSRLDPANNYNGSWFLFTVPTPSLNAFTPISKSGIPRVRVLYLTCPMHTSSSLQG